MLNRAFVTRAMVVCEVLVLGGWALLLLGA